MIAGFVDDDELRFRGRLPVIVLALLKLVWVGLEPFGAVGSSGR